MKKPLLSEVPNPVLLLNDQSIRIHKGMNLFYFELEHVQINFVEGFISIPSLLAARDVINLFQSIF